MTEHADELKIKLAKAGRILAAQGQGEWTRGHLSLRCPQDPHLFWMKPKRVGLEEMTPDSLITVNLDGEKVEGENPRHGEVFIHSEILRARPDVNAVIHVHPLHAIVFSSLGKPFVAVGLPGAVFEEGLPIFNETTQLITTPERGAAVARSLGSCRAVILQNHGVVTVGASIEEAIYYAMALESACQMQVLAEAAGGPKAVGSPGETRALREYMLREGMFRTTFNYLDRAASKLK